MTTIVYKKGTLAADTQETVGEVPRKCKKLFKYGAHTVIATAGDSYTGMMFVEWWRAGADVNNKPDLTSVASDEDFECLVWDGQKLWCVNRMFLLVEVNLEDHPFYAIGCGADVAIGALAMGASAKHAVEIACEYNVFTGLPVQVMKLKEKDSE